MTQSHRLPGGQIDRTAPLKFTFDGKAYGGHHGDTLASALMANGVRLMGRSFKYHRPRGVLSSGSEEPNALVQLRSGAASEPNTRATIAELFDGLEATSQNRWPSLTFDTMAVNDALAPFLTAGFYYKTFMWPRAFWEKLYEPVIRHAAGLGRLSKQADPDVYDKGYLHCDLLVIGAGPAGLSAALTAGRAGVDVILCDEDFVMGGRLNAETLVINDGSALDWRDQALAELASLPNVRLMPRCTVFGTYDHGVFGALERVGDHLAQTPTGTPRQILWRIYSRASILCAGATERPIAFADNDRPGIMLGGAVRAYVNRWAALPARRAAVFACNDEGHRTALDLMAKGIEIAAVIDPRADARAIGDYPLLAGASVVGTKGRLGLRDIQVRRHDGSLQTLQAGVMAMSGGWNPNVHLTCHQRGRPVWDAALSAFVPGPDLPVGMSVAGAAAGQFSTHAALTSGAKAALNAAQIMGINAKSAALPRAEDAPSAQTAFWYVSGARGRAWLDQQNDVTVKDVKLAHQEGMTSVEHVKRYTTLGMATDQGKTANIAALAVMADLQGKTIPEVGTTIFRPPYTPVPMGALAGRARDTHFRPTRHTPSHDWALEQGAAMVEVGPWLRAQYFPQAGETHWRQSVDREAQTVRRAVGVCDVTTLGKIDVQGRDAAAFLNRVYCNGFAKLAVGRTRYGLMLREDGIAMDDGTAARLAEGHFVVTTTTANAVSVFRHMEFCRQCLWPDLDVHLMSTTDAWAQFAIAGPAARTLVSRVVDPAFDVSNEAFPFMACGAVTVCGGVAARLFRISFSGELAYELAVPTRYGDALIRHLMTLGADLGVAPYGTETLGVLRIEKGHGTGNELNGQTSPHTLGMGRMVSKAKDSIGSALSQRPELTCDTGLRLVGLIAEGAGVLRAGAHLLDKTSPADAPPDISHDLGWLSSACYSPHIGGYIALAFVKGGDQRMDDTLRVYDPMSGGDVTARIASPHFIDPKGERLRA